MLLAAHKNSRCYIVTQTHLCHIAPAMTAHAHTLAPVGLGLEARGERVAIGLSGLCAIHCVASSVLLALAASAGGLLDPRIRRS